MNATNGMTLLEVLDMCQDNTLTLDDGTVLVRPMRPARPLYFSLEDYTVQSTSPDGSLLILVPREKPNG